MSKSYRRFEILLPLQFNDGRPIPAELIADTLLELRQRFGAVFLEFKERIKTRFEQIDIWMTTYLLEVI